MYGRLLLVAFRLTDQRLEPNDRNPVRKPSRQVSSWSFTVVLAGPLNFCPRDVGERPGVTVEEIQGSVTITRCLGVFKACKPGNDWLAPSTVGEGSEGTSPAEDS